MFQQSVFAEDCDILQCVIEGNTEKVSQFLDQGANPDTDPRGFSLIREAVAQGDIEMAHLLRSRGARLDVKAGEGRTLLDIAAIYDQSEMIPWLFENGLDYSEWGDGEVLHRAIRSNSLDFAEKLVIEYDFDVNQQDGHGWVPIHFAAFFGNTSGVELLTAQGADVFLENERGYTPLGLTLYSQSQMPGLDKEIADQMLPIKRFYDISSESAEDYAKIAQHLHLKMTEKKLAEINIPQQKEPEEVVYLDSDKPEEKMYPLEPAEPAESGGVILEAVGAEEQTEKPQDPVTNPEESESTASEDDGKVEQKDPAANPEESESTASEDDGKAEQTETGKDPAANPEESESTTSEDDGKAEQTETGKDPAANPKESAEPESA